MFRVLEERDSAAAAPIFFCRSAFEGDDLLGSGLKENSQSDNRLKWSMRALCPRVR